MDNVQKAYQEFIFKSRYSKWLPDENRRETFDETVTRYMTHLYNQAKLFGWNMGKKEYSEIYDAIISGNVMPSMRGFMMAGKALERDNASIFNCSYVTMSNPKAFDETVYLLMLGCGVGFSVERQYINQLPDIAEEMHTCDTVIDIPDSRIGWASAIRQLISLLYSGHIPSWDISKLRPAGTVLKTTGGRSSGPAPLNNLMHFIVKTFKNAKGRKLNSIECHDIICKIAESIVVGGVRRSSSISLSNLTDMRMSQAKTGEWHYIAPHRSLANISVAYTEKPDVSAFIGEMKNLYDSKSGERGIFNRIAAIKQTERTERRNPDQDFGTNPCVPKNALLLDGDRYRRISDQNAENWTSWKTGIKDTIKLRTSQHLEVVCTPDHKLQLFDGSWIEAKDAKGERLRNPMELIPTRFPQKHNPDTFLRGFLWGRCFYSTEKGAIEYRESRNEIRDAAAYLNGENWKKEKRYRATAPGDVATWVKSRRKLEKRLGNIDFMETHWNRRTVPEEIMTADYHTVAAWLSGVFMSSGRGNPATGHLFFSPREISESQKIVQLLLLLGIHASVSNAAQETEYDAASVSIPWRNNAKFEEIVGSCSEKMRKCANYYRKTKRNKYISVKDIEPNGKMEVWDFRMKGDQPYNVCQGYVLHNCGETILADCQMCNLSEAVVRPNDNIRDVEHKLKIATRIGTIQSTFTDFRYLRKRWKNNLEEERLLGVSMTGIMDNPFFSGRINKNTLKKELARLKKIVIDENKKYAKKLKIEPSKAITLIKPSGSVSKMVNSSPGIHPRLYGKYIGNVRGNVNDPITKLLINENVPYEQCVYSPEKTIVFKFPLQSPSSSVLMNSVPGIEQMNLVRLYRKYFCEHNVSCTIHLGQEEWMDAMGWIWNNWNEIGGMTFLPKTDTVYTQAPYQEVDDNEWKDVAAKFPENINWERLAEFENEDNTVKKLECTGGACHLDIQ